MNNLELIGKRFFYYDEEYEVTESVLSECRYKAQSLDNGKIHHFLWENVERWVENYEKDKKKFRCSNIKCNNKSCEHHNGKKNCKHKIHKISLDPRGSCEIYTSKYCCIVCGNEINYKNSKITTTSDICDDCDKQINNGDIKVIHVSEFEEYGLHGARVGREIIIDNTLWKIIKVIRRKYKILEAVSKYIDPYKEPEKYLFYK